MELIDLLKSHPPLLQYRKWKYRKLFETKNDWNLFYGMYDSFDAAMPHVPSNRPVGYDTEEAAGMYSSDFSEPRLVDYPLFFWLSGPWPKLKHVMDFGGHRGSLFYHSTALLGPGPKWTVYDLPEVVKAGRKRASEKKTVGLTFESKMELIDNVDTVVASGSLQYLEDDIPEWLGKLHNDPTHLFINMLPLHPSREFVTINNMGTAYCPYKIRLASAFRKQLVEQGWKTIAEWSIPGKGCVVPFHVEPFEVTYRGGYYVKE